jgi:hypothetical protein
MGWKLADYLLNIKAFILLYKPAQTSSKAARTSCSLADVAGGICLLILPSSACARRPIALLHVLLSKSA